MNFPLELKEATCELHARLDQHPGMLHILGPNCTREDYARFLTRWYSVLSEIEENVYPHLLPVAGQVSLDKRRRAQQAWQDLQTLEYSPSSSELIARTFDFNNPSLAAAIGVLYVIEGSTLGGEFIRRQLSQTLKHLPKESFVFLRSYGEERGKMWQECQAFIQSYFSKRPEEFNSAVTAARDTFQYFINQI